MQYRTRRMERKLFVWFVAVLAAVSLVFSYSIPAWASDETSIELNQNISIGNVDVESVTSSGANPGNDGYVVSRVNFSATNAGSLAFYTRAKIDVLFYDSLGNLVSNLDTSYIRPNIVAASNASGAWVDGGDGYWYWNNLVNPGETTAHLVEGALASFDIPNEYLNYTIRLNVHYEAIQATHLAADETWNQADIYENAREITTVENLGTQISATLTDDGLSTSTPSELSEVHLSPGGKVIYDINLENQTGTSRQFYLGAQLGNLSSEQKDLLNRYLHIQIQDADGNLVWSGTFGDLSGADIALVTLAQSGSSRLQVQASLAADAPNALQNLNSSIIWKISVAEEEGATNSGQATDSNTQSGNNTDTSASEIPDTGDMTSGILPISLLGMAAALFAITYGIRRQEF